MKWTNVAMITYNGLHEPYILKLMNGIATK